MHALASQGWLVLDIRLKPRAIFWQPAWDARAHLLGHVGLASRWLDDLVDYDRAWSEYRAMEDDEPCSVCMDWYASGCPAEFYVGECTCGQDVAAH